MKKKLGEDFREARQEMEDIGNKLASHNLPASAPVTSPAPAPYSQQEPYESVPPAKFVPVPVIPVTSEVLKELKEIVPVVHLHPGDIIETPAGDLLKVVDPNE